MIIHVRHIFKDKPVLTANGYLNATMDKEIYGFSVEELRNEMKIQNQFHYMSGPFKIVKYSQEEWGLDEYIEYNENDFKDIPDNLIWWVMRENKIEEAIKYGAGKFRAFQRQYLREHYNTVWELQKELL